MTAALIDVPARSSNTAGGANRGGVATSDAGTDHSSAAAVKRDGPDPAVPMLQVPAPRRNAPPRHFHADLWARVLGRPHDRTKRVEGYTATGPLADVMRGSLCSDLAAFDPRFLHDDSPQVAVDLWNELCRHCPVRAGCLAWAVAHYPQERGIWAGTTWRQRRALAREPQALVAG